MTRHLALLPPCLLLLTLAACDTGSGDPTKVQYAASLGVDLSVMQRSDSGLYTLDQTVGSGAEATVRSTLKVNYSGWLPDGTLFDSSLNPGRDPFVFTLGVGQVIPGWDEGMVGMKVGGKRRLVIPSNLGYGTSGSSPSIPPNSVLIFDVQLLSVS